MPVRRRSVAMVYQQFVNYPSLTVYENIASPLRVAGRRQRRDRGAGAAKRRSCCGSSRMLERTAGAAVRRPAAAHRDRPRAGQARRLVLLDEPLANLDYKLREELREELPRMFAADRRDLRLRHHRAHRGAAARRHAPSRCGRAACTQVGADRRWSIASPANHRCRARLLRSAAERTRRDEARRLWSHLPTARSCRPTALLAGLPDGAYRLGFRADAVAHRAADAAALTPFPATSR